MDDAWPPCLNHRRLGAGLGWAGVSTAERYATAMDLPFILLDAVWHIGSTASGGTLVQRGVKGWDFEFGLLSVSLDPEAWRADWAGTVGVIHEVSAPGRPLCFLDADATLACHGSAIETAAVANGLIRREPSGIVATSVLYAALDLTPGSQVHMEARSFEDQVLQAALAVLASCDETIDGLWWPDTLGATMRTERGGVFQHLLSHLSIGLVPSATTAARSDCQLPTSNLDQGAATVA